MLRYKSKKQAILIAALVILLCLVCLTGSTLALFTNDPNDGSIGIITTSGRVDVDLVDTTEAHNSLEGEYLEFFTTSENQTIYFEPGATFYTQGFQIMNKGNVPINFRLSVSESENFNMKAFLEGFDVWITTDPTTTPPPGYGLDEVSPCGYKLTEFTGRLEKNGDIGDISGTYYLVVKMKESADNTFQGQTYSGIGVTVFAVQGNVDIEE